MDDDTTGPSCIPTSPTAPGYTRVWACRTSVGQVSVGRLLLVGPVRLAGASASGGAIAGAGEKLKSHSARRPHITSGGKSANGRRGPFVPTNAPPATFSEQDCEAALSAFSLFLAGGVA
jgi:hypothetical protein